MQIPSNASFLAMQQEKLFGKGSHKFSLSLYICLLFLFFLTTSCTKSTPTLNRTYLPVSFDISKIEPTAHWSKSSRINVIHINDKPHHINTVAKYWSQRNYNKLFEKEHPVANLNLNDISALKHALRDIFDVFYFYSSSGKPQTFSAQDLRNAADCKPLSNLEIRFLMSSGIENAFPQKPLTMLFVSALELLTIKGAIPIYPKVYSPYLRSQYNLNPLLSLENLNLIEAKDFSIPLTNGVNGLIFCRKKI